MRDLRFLLGELRRSDLVDATRSGVAGYSWGGLGAVVAAMRDPDLAAVLGIDASIKGFNPLAQSALEFDPRHFRAAFLLLSANDPQGERLFYDALDSAPARVVSFPVLSHEEMNAIAFLGAFAAPSPKLPSYAVFFAEARRFFAETLSRAAAPTTAVDPAVAKVMAKRPRAAPPTPLQFLQVLANCGPARARELFDAARAAAPAVPLFDEEVLTSEAYAAAFERHRPADGIALLPHGDRGLSRLSRARGRLGKMLEKDGQGAAALPLYREALALTRRDSQADPNSVAFLKKRIAALEGGAPERQKEPR